MLDWDIQLQIISNTLGLATALTGLALLLPLSPFPPLPPPPPPLPSSPAYLSDLDTADDGGEVPNISTDLDLITGETHALLDSIYMCQHQ